MNSLQNSDQPLRQNDDNVMRNGSVGTPPATGGDQSPRTNLDTQVKEDNVDDTRENGPNKRVKRLKTIDTNPPKQTSILQLAQKFLAAPEESQMKLTYAAYDSLIRIASHLDFRNKLKLREVCKTWKQIIDSEEAWKSVMICGDDEVDFSEFEDHIIERYQPKEIILRDFVTDSPNGYKDMGDFESIERLRIQTERPEANRQALEFISGMANIGFEVQITWELKVSKGEDGVTKVALSQKRYTGRKDDPAEYCFDWFPELKVTDKRRRKMLVIEVEASEIEKKYQEAVSKRDDDDDEIAPVLTLLFNY